MGQKKKSNTINQARENKTAPVTQHQAQGSHSILPVRLMLIDLRQRIKSAQKQSAGHHRLHRRMQAFLQNCRLMAALGHQEKDEASPAAYHREITDKRIFF